MKKRRLFRLRYILPAVALVAAAAAVPAFRGPAQPAGAAGATPLVVERGEIESTLLVSGLVKPSVTIEVRAEASGLVETTPVKDGDRVSAGQVLVTLDSRVAQTAVQEAEAQLKQAELQLESSRLDADEDTLAVRRVTHERNLQLFQRGLVPRSEVDASELQVRLAERSLERARRNLLANEARIEQLRAQLEQRRAQLQHTIVRSPIGLFVGAVGVANVLLVSVRERTQEIGVRRAIGATRHDIFVGFLIEALAITLMGGLAGLAGAWVLTLIAGLIPAIPDGAEPHISFMTAAIAVSILLLVGVVAGVGPARRAAAVFPSEALRAE